MRTFGKRVRRGGKRGGERRRGQAGSVSCGRGFLELWFSRRGRRGPLGGAVAELGALCPGGLGSQRPVPERHAGGGRVGRRSPPRRCRRRLAPRAQVLAGETGLGRTPALPQWGSRGERLGSVASGPRTLEGAARSDIPGLRAASLGPHRRLLLLSASWTVGPSQELGAAPVEWSPPADPLNYWRWERQWRVRPTHLRSYF